MPQPGNDGRQSGSQETVDREASTGLSGPAQGAEASQETEPLRIPGYTILAELGRGGMGVVYKARQSSLGRIVAIKMVLAGSHADAEANKRFLGEAEAVARLKHRNIIQIYEFGTIAGHPFFSLEFCEAGSLANLLSQSLLKPVQATRLLRQLADGMQAAHDQGIIHRDIKPANVLLASPVAPGPGGSPSADFVPKIADFGLAKRLEVELSASEVILGTPSYMAPEQTQDAKVIDARTDLHALGAILYECLTGRPPFMGAGVLDTLEQVRIREPIPPRQLQPNIPHDLETICLKCLQKDPARRYASAADLADDLQCFLDGQPITARAVGRLERGWKWGRRNRAMAGLYAVSALATLVLLGLGLWFSAGLRAARDEIALERAEREKQEAEAGIQAAQAASARQLAALGDYFRQINEVRERNQQAPEGWTWQGLADLRKAAALQPGAEHLPQLRSVAASCLGGVTLGEQKRVGGGTHPATVAFHPDGSTLAIGEVKALDWVSCSVLLVDVGRGKTTRQLTLPPFQTWQLSNNAQDGVTSLAFSPDGAWLVAGTRSGSLHRWDLRQRTPEESWHGHANSVDGLTFGRDGKALYSMDKETLKRWEVATWKEAGVFKGVKEGIFGPVISPTADWVACLHQDGLRLLDGSTLQIQRPATVIGGVRFVVSPDGRCLFVADESALRMVDLISLEVLAHFRLPGDEKAHHDRITNLAVSPDGTLLASADGDSRHVRLWDVANGRLLADVNVSGGSVQLAFGADSRTLAVCAEKDTILYQISGKARSTPGVYPRPVLETTWLRGEPTLASLALSFINQGCQMGELGFCPVSDLTEVSRASPTRAVGVFLSPFRETSTPLALTADGRQAAWPLEDGVRGWDSGASFGCGRWLDLTKPGPIQFGPDGRLWTAVGKQVQAWSVPEGKETVRWSNDLSDPVAGVGDVMSLRVGVRQVAVGSRDGRLTLLRARDAGVILSHLLGISAVQAIDFDREEGLALFGTEKGAVGVFDVAKGEVLASQDAHRDGVDSVAFIAPGLLASGSRDRTVRLWRLDANRLEEILTLPCSGPVRRVTATSDGARLAVLVKGERAVRVWHLDQLRAELADMGIDPGLPVMKPISRPFDAKPWLKPSEPPHMLSCLRADLFQGVHFERLVRTRFDVQVDWDWGASSPDSSLHSIGVFSIRWQGWLRPPVAGTYVFALDHTNTARLWIDDKLLIDSDPANPKSVSEATVELTGPAHKIRVEYLNPKFSAKCRLLWEVPTPDNAKAERVVVKDCLFPDRETLEWAVPVKAIRRFAGSESAPRSMALTPDGKFVLMVDNDGLIRVWDLATGEKVRAQKLMEELMVAATFSNDGKLALGGMKCLRLWDVEKGKELRTYPGHTCILEVLSFALDGKRFASGSTPPENTLRVWDLGGKELVRLDGHKGYLAGLAWTPDGKELVSSTTKGEIRIWDVNTWKPIADLTSPFGVGHKVAVSPDGRWLALVAGWFNSGVAMYDLAQRRLVWYRNRPSSDCTLALAFSPGSRWLATGGDGVIRLWDVAQGIELCQFDLGRKAQLRTIAFSPDGQYLLAGGTYDLATLHYYKIPERLRTPVQPGKGMESRPIR